MNIAEILVRQASECGDSPALIDAHRGRERMVTFRDLDTASARMAEQIARHGIGKGDAVLILHPTAAEVYAFLIALFRVGAMGMFLDPSAGRDYVERCLQIFSPQAFFGSAKAQLLRLLIPSLRRVGLAICTSRIPGSLYLPLSADGPEKNAVTPMEDSGPALLTFTSGSTGQPKAALRSHGFLVAQYRVLKASLDHREGAMDLTTLPVFVLANLASGVTSVLPDADMRRPGHIRPRPVLAQLQRLPVSTMVASPAFVACLTRECRAAGLRLPHMRHVFMGGAPVFPEDLRQAREIFPQAEISAVYGSTEAEPMAEVALSQIAPEDFAAMRQGRGLLTGCPAPSLALRILRNQWGTPLSPLDRSSFDAQCLGEDQVGEIVVSGDHVLSGYLKGEGDTETKFRVGSAVWHRTGDLGQLDHQGRLWLMGRASAAINDQRGILYPFAVECAARQVPGIRRAAILSVDGRRVLAIEAHSGLDAEMVRRELGWAHLDEVRLLRSIPMDKRHNAKVDYVGLRKLLSQR
jgi:acyl-CoA synthetase (AMP-forming)/AMP-acid ligase II